MGDELTFEAVLTTVDRLLEVSPREMSSGGELWSKLDNILDGLLGAAKFDAARHGRLAELAASLKAAAAFLFVLGLYVVLLTAILMSYAVEIELGDDPLAKRVVLARSLPVALGVFTLGAVVGGQMLTAIIG